MEIRFERLASEHREQVIDIFNHYVENGMAAYPERKLPYEAFDALLTATTGYPALVARSARGEVVGFATLRPHHHLSTFSGAAEITYFLKDGWTGKGIGETLLDLLVRGAEEKGLSSILASISSRNEGSIRFHARHGFAECGRFRRIGRKNGKTFDVVWMQRMLEEKPRVPEDVPQA